jgi:hypothetical protein
MEIDMLNDEQARESACKEREIQPNYIHSLRKKKKEKPCLPEGRAKEPPTSKREAMRTAYLLNFQMFPSPVIWSR